MQEQFRRRRLPHLDRPGALYFVTTCLKGSIPASGLQDIDDYRSRLDYKLEGEPIDRRTQWKLLFARSDQWLDKGIAANHLTDERLARIVENSLLHFAGQRYSIWSWNVMSNHIHWVFEPCSNWVAGLGDDANARTPRERIMHSVKRFSAIECNLALGRTGKFWQEESYDHCVTESDELQRIVNYIEMNPVKASLCERPEQFRFSSAHYRSCNRLAPGRPLIGTTNLTSFD